MKPNDVAYFKEYRKTHPDRTRELSRASYLKTKNVAFRMVAASKGDGEPRCRIDLTLDTPVSALPCVGSLQIDHLNGGGNKEARHSRHGGGASLYIRIAKGERATVDLRLLCQLHQLWNQIEELQ